MTTTTPIRKASQAFDSNSIIADLNQRGAKVVISQHPRRIKPLAIDAEIYNWRHLIENFFRNFKEFKRIAMRADKTDTSFNAIIHLSAAIIHSRSFSTDLIILLFLLGWKRIVLATGWKS